MSKSVLKTTLALDLASENNSGHKHKKKQGSKSKKKKKDMKLKTNSVKNKLQLIKRLGKSSIDKDVVKTITNHHIGRLAKNRPSPKKKKKETKSVFTEEDFKKFEEEYFVQGRI